MKLSANCLRRVVFILILPLSFDVVSVVCLWNLQSDSANKTTVRNEKGTI